MKKITDLSFLLRFIMFLGAYELMNLSRINNLFWYTQIQKSPLIIFSAELIASALLVVLLVKGLRVNLRANPFLKRGLITLSIGLIVVLGLCILTKWVNFYWYSFSEDLVWRPYFIMENFLFVPLLQELIFRELFLKIFPTKRVWFYVLSSSLVYSALLFISSGFSSFLIFTFLSALVFSSLRWYSRDIKLSIVLHILLNCGVYFL